MRNRIHRAAPALSLASLVLALAGCTEEPIPEAPVRPVASVCVGDAGDFGSSRFSGQARAAEEADMAFEVAGRIVERSVDVGSQIRRGDLLARLDPRDFEADVASAQANEAKTVRDYERARQLYESDAIAAADLDIARRRLDVAAAELRKAEKALEETRLVAPFDGTVAATYLEAFQSARAKQPVLRLIDISRIEMVIDIPEHRIGAVPYIQWVKVRFEVFPEHEIDATITEVGNEASLTTRTYPVTLALQPPRGAEIKPGMSGVAWAGVEYPEDVSSAGLEIPAAALFSSPESSSEQSFVWVIDESALTVSAREVETIGAGPRGIRVRGLAAGERIAVAGVHSLRDGMEIRLLDE